MKICPVLCGIVAALLVTVAITNSYESKGPAVRPFVEEVIPIFRTVKPGNENAVLLCTTDKAFLAIPKEDGWKVTDVSGLNLC